MLARLRRWTLLYVLLLVAGSAWLTQSRLASWDEPLWVVVHPINADGSEASREHIASLRADSFQAMDAFFAEEAAHHRLSLRNPVKVMLGASIAESPPLPPAAPSTLEIVLWSLRLRWWAWQVDRGPDPPPAEVTLFVRYFDPETTPVMTRSLGLKEGLIGVVNVFASARDRGGNQVIMAHELLHTLGAADRYDPRTNLPLWPDGYAEPDLEPRYPQSLAELMGGRIPIDPASAEIPRSLDAVVIGNLTATEIGWKRP